MWLVPRCHSLLCSGHGALDSHHHAPPKSPRAHLHEPQAAARFAHAGRLLTPFPCSCKQHSHLTYLISLIFHFLNGNSSHCHNLGPCMYPEETVCERECILTDQEPKPQMFYKCQLPFIEKILS